MGTAVATKQTHKVKKGETLIGIAKKYGHKDWKAIWKAPENKSIASKRKDPEKIEPGDALVIPLNAKQRKENDAKLLALNEARNAELQLCTGLTNQVQRLQRSIKLYDELIQSNVQSTKRIVDDLKKNLAGMKKWGDGVDAVAMLTQMGVSLGKIAKTGQAATKASGAALKKLNDEAAKEAVGIATGPLKGEALKAAGKLKKQDSTAVAIIGILADSWNKMTSPSFWAHTYVQMTENGKSWSDAVTMEIGDDIKQRIQQVVANSAKHIKKLQAKQQALKAELAAIGGLAKGCRARIQAYEKAAAAFPQ